MAEEEAPPPTWLTPSFWGLLCDPYAQGTMLEAGEVLHGVHGLARALDTLVLKDAESKAAYLPGFSDGDLAKCDALLPMLKACFEVCQNASQIQEPPQLAALALELQTRIRAMAVNDMMLIPGGWDDGFRHRSKVTFVLVKVGQTAQGSDYTFVTCNSGMGKHYHLPRATEDAELQYATCMELPGIPGAKMEDPCFLSFLLSQPITHEGHREETLYEALLPWLAGRPLLQALTAERVAAADFRRPACANTSCTTSVVEAVRYVLRRQGVAEPLLARFEFALRLSHAHLARDDLRKLQEGEPAAADGAPAADPTASSSPLGETVLGKLRGTTLVDNADAPHTLDGEEVVGLYFSAHWCPPCRAFTPSLVQTYQQLRAQGARFQIVFVSSDRSAGAFAEYFASMPWLCVPFPQQALREDLGRLCNVAGIPNLTLVRVRDGAVLAGGRNLVARRVPFADWFNAHDAAAAAAAAPRLPARTAGTGAGDDGAAGDAADAAAAAAAESLAEPKAPEKLTSGEARIIQFGTAYLAKLAVDEHAAGRLPDAELGQVSLLVDDIEARLRSLLPPTAVAHKLLPPPIAATVTAPLTDLGNAGLLLNTGEDQYRGERAALRPFAHVNLLALPSRANIHTPEDAINALELCGQMVVQLMDNALKANAVVTQRLATEHLAIQLLCNCLTEVVPMPVPQEGDRSSCIWAVRLTQANQVRAMRAVWRAMHQLALLFQDIDTPSRTFDSQRAVAAMCGLAIFDVVVRTRATDNVMALTDMLEEEGGFSFSLDIGRSRRVTVDVGSATYELASTQLCEARTAALAYLVSVKKRCRFELFSLNQTNEMEGSTHGYSIKMDRYDSSMAPTTAFDSHATVATMRFVAHYVERLGCVP
jgi:thiol-disulfide isomerase/thioredoxin